MSNINNSMYDKLMRTKKELEKQAAEGHPTDQELEKEKANQPEPPKDDTVEDIGAPGVDEDEEKTEPENPTPANVDEESSQKPTGDTITPGGDHPTEKELKDEAAKTANIIENMQSTGEAIQQGLKDLLKSADEDEEKEAADSEDDEDKDDKDKKKETPDSEDKDDKEEEDEDTVEEEIEEAMKAGKEASELVSDGINSLMQQEKAATIEQELRAMVQMGKESADDLSDTIDAAVAPAMQEEPAPELAPEPAPEPGGEEVVGLEEFLATLQTLLDGKEPENDMEAEIQEQLRATGLLPGTGEAPEAEGSPEEEEEPESIKEEIGAGEEEEEKIANILGDISDEDRVKLLQTLIRGK